MGNTINITEVSVPTSDMPDPVKAADEAFKAGEQFAHALGQAARTKVELARAYIERDRVDDRIEMLEARLRAEIDAAVEKQEAAYALLGEGCAQTRNPELDPEPEQDEELVRERVIKYVGGLTVTVDKGRGPGYATVAVEGEDDDAPVPMPPYRSYTVDGQPVPERGLD